MSVLHDPARLLAFITFSAVVAGTPGPGNALLTAAGARAGVRRGIPSLLGQVTGMGAMLFAITLGLGNLLLAHPLALAVLKWGGAAALCLMAWRIATAGPAGSASGATAGFLGMAAFQWVNPKGWLIGVAAIATFLDRRSGALTQAVAFAIVFMLTALPSCLPWLAFGASLRRLLQRAPRARVVLNATLALLLAASTVPLLLTRL